MANDTSSRRMTRSAKMEEQIKHASALREKKQLLDELAKRISIAREGRVQFEKMNYPIALERYRRFLALTAKGFSVEVPDLSPDMFEEKRRVAEALLLSSVLMDLLKILDHLNSPSAKDDRVIYQRLFIAFTFNQPFQGFAAENLRKFLKYNRGINNREELWNLYTAIRIKKFCIIATSLYGEEAVELAILRNFRNKTLSRYIWGRTFISFYYKAGPFLNTLIMSSSLSRVIVKKGLEKFTSALHRKNPAIALDFNKQKERQTPIL